MSCAESGTIDDNIFGFIHVLRSCSSGKVVSTSHQVQAAVCRLCGAPRGDLQQKRLRRLRLRLRAGANAPHSRDAKSEESERGHPDRHAPYFNSRRERNANVTCLIEVDLY